MAWPPPVPPNTRANNTLELDNHPSDHNMMADALSALIARATNAGWGMIGQSTVTASGATTTTTPADLPNSALTFTPVVGRRYKIWARALQVVSVATNVVECRIRDSANANVAIWSCAPSAGNVGNSVAPEVIVNFATTAPVTVKLSYVVVAGAGNTYLYADNTPGGITRLVVEDVGPVTPMVVP